MRELTVSCLLGGAIGDALGMPVERVAASVIESYWASPIRCFQAPVPQAPCFQYQLSAGMYTDDTQAVRATAIAIAKHKTASPGIIADALAAWLFEESLGQKPRYPGQTTWTAMDRYRRERNPSTCGVASDSCGAAIRISPVALWLCREKWDCFERGIETTARVTHTGDGAVDGAKIVGRLIRSASEGTIPALAELSGACKSKRMAGAIASVEIALNDRHSRNDMAVELGGGTKAREVVPMALFHLYANKFSFEQSMYSAIDTRHPSGLDMDSIVGIVGAVAGAFNPQAVLESALLTELHDRDTIIREAGELHKAMNGLPVI